MAVQARDRTVEVISELRGIGCDLHEAVRWGFLNGSTVECETAMNISEALVLVVDALLSVEHGIKRAGPARGSCGHDEIHPYVPEGYERPVSGIYRCVACDEVLVEIKCRGCEIEMLPHQMARHLAERCWAT